MIKILFLTTNLDFGGSERRCITLAIELKKKGFEVEVACLGNSAQDYFSELIKREGISIIKLGGGNVISISRRLRSHILNENISSVVSILYKPNLINCLSAIGGHKWKVIVGEPSAFRQAQEFLGWKFVLKSKVMARLFRFSNHIVCNSFNAKSSILKYYPSYNSKVEVIYNPVNIGPINTPYVIRRDGKTHFCVAASFQVVKNPLNLAIAISNLDNITRGKVIFDWYGHAHSEELYHSVERVIEQEGLGDCLVLHDATKDISDKMNQADCVALFSAHEGLPNAICEGLVIGRPILMSRCSDYNILVNGNGTLCDWDNVDSIKTAIERIVNATDNELLNMGLKSKEIASERLNKDSIIRQWVDILN